MMNWSGESYESCVFVVEDPERGGSDWQDWQGLALWDIAQSLMFLCHAAAATNPSRVGSPLEGKPADAERLTAEERLRKATQARYDAFCGGKKGGEKGGDVQS